MVGLTYPPDKLECICSACAHLEAIEHTSRDLLTRLLAFAILRSQPPQVNPHCVPCTPPFPIAPPPLVLLPPSSNLASPHPLPSSAVDSPRLASPPLYPLTSPPLSPLPSLLSPRLSTHSIPPPPPTPFHFVPLLRPTLSVRCLSSRLVSTSSPLLTFAHRLLLCLTRPPFTQAKPYFLDLVLFPYPHQQRVRRWIPPPYLLLERGEA